MFQTRRIAHVLAGFAVVAATGCGAEIPGTDGAKVSKDGDTFKVENDSGSLESSASLPDDFPKDEIPLLDGKIINATSIDTETDRGFTVAMSVDGESLEEIADRGAALLEDDGYKENGNMDSADLIIRGYENDSWTVSLTVTASGQENVVSYTVAGKQTSDTP